MSSNTFNYFLLHVDRLPQNYSSHYDLRVNNAYALHRLGTSVLGKDDELYFLDLCHFYTLHCLKPSGVAVHSWCDGSIFTMIFTKY